VQEKFADWGSTLGYTGAGKAKRIMNSKVEFSEKLRNLFDERGYEKLAAKVSMFLAQSHAKQFS
jgi:hypothetical protein